MITSVKVENFRAFSNEVHIRFAPITVLIGRNSAGKSSLLKFLLMLQQTLEGSRDPDKDPFFVTEGVHVRLGRWHDLQNTNAERKQLRYEVKLTTDELPPREIQDLWPLLERGQVVQTLPDTIRIQLDLPREKGSQSIDCPTDFTISGTVGYGRTTVTGEHSGKAEQAGRNIFSLAEKQLKRVGFLDFSQRGSSIPILLKQFAAEQFLQPLRTQFLRIRHLSPVREESENTIQTGSPPPGMVGHRGEYALPHLVDLLDTRRDGLRAQFLEKHVRAITDVESFTFRRSGRRMLTEVLGTNAVTGARTYLSDFGFGVGQILPVMIQGALMNEGETLIVEQPEAQLHPTAQLDVGSYFADLWNEFHIPSIIETHSANILLRLRRLVSERKLDPSDVAVAYFTTDKALDQREEGIANVFVRNLDIQANGAMRQGLPMEFFGADILEGLKLGRKEEG